MMKYFFFSKITTYYIYLFNLSYCSTRGGVSFQSLDLFKASPLDLRRCTLYFLVGEDFQKMSDAIGQVMFYPSLAMLVKWIH